jgi:hypothetical protein
MIQDLFAWLLATFVIGPMQAELKGVQAPAAVMQEIQACVVSGTPARSAKPRTTFSGVSPPPSVSRQA